jgi:hypothetical protein
MANCSWVEAISPEVVVRIQVRGLPLQEGGSQVGKVVEAFQEVALEKAQVVVSQKA